MALCFFHATLLEAHRYPLATSMSAQLNGAFSQRASFLVVIRWPMCKLSCPCTFSVRWSSRNSSQQQRVRCNVCGKEVCNKYFLRNHKFKKHGIPLEASAPPVRRPLQQSDCGSQLHSALTHTPASQSQQQQQKIQELHAMHLPYPSKLQPGGAPASLEATFKAVIADARADMPACPTCGLLCPDRHHLELHLRAVSMCSVTLLSF